MLGLIAHQESVAKPISSFVVINNGQYRVTPTRVLVKRSDSSDDDEDSSSSSSSTKTKNTKCTGSKQQCELPTNSKHTTAVTVGVAVAIPVAVVIILLCVILYIVYRRSKKEAQEDNDPDFEGDSEYLPHQNTYEMHNQFSSSDSNQFMKEKVDQAFYNGMSMAPPGAAAQGYPQPRSINGDNPFSNRNSSWTADPFQLPETENTDSLREFAKQVQNDGFGGYQLASRNGSQVSLHNNDQNSFISTSRLSNMRIMTNQSDLNNPIVVPTDGNMRSRSNSKNNSPLKMETTDVGGTAVINNNGPEGHDPSARKLVFSQEVETFDNDDDDDDDEFVFENKNAPHNTEIKPQHLNVSSKHLNDEDNQYASNIPLSPEEENIQRMKSIYKVYLDQNESAHDQNGGDDQKVVSATTSPQKQPEPVENLSPSPQKDTVPVTQHVDIPQVHIQDDSTSNQNQVEEEGDNQNNNSVDNNLDVNRMSRRVASSIYSEAPVQAYQSQLQHQSYGFDQNYNQDPNFGMMQQQSYGYPPQQQTYNNYPPLPNMPSQYMHPQTLEQIDELPMPSKLINSSSSNSLTSFKQSTKLQPQSSNMLQPAWLNGTALNPMDHPEMFYSNNTDDMMMMNRPAYAGNSSMSFVSNNSQVSNIVSPHQMRKSIVMTNPAELQAPTTYKPAGSLRNLGPQQPIGMDPYYQQQQQQIQSRVSGILENNDMVQPPSVGGILPHSGSQEDLRKQLGSSDNYTVQ